MGGRIRVRLTPFVSFVSSASFFAFSSSSAYSILLHLLPLLFSLLFFSHTFVEMAQRLPDSLPSGGVPS